MALADELQGLFQVARQKGGLDYLMTLVRLEGIGWRPDPLIALRETLRTPPATLTDDEQKARYCALAEVVEPRRVIANLIRCVSGTGYDMTPEVSDLPAQLRAEDRSQLAHALEAAYPAAILAACGDATAHIDRGSLARALSELESLLTVFLEVYAAQLRSYSDWPQYVKMQKLEVLEILRSEDGNLYGFHIHFANGSTATFERHLDHTVLVNISPGPPVELWVGNLDEMSGEYRVRHKRLYEIPLPGRYNYLGEWKPIVFPGDGDKLLAEARSLSPDPDVQGAVFYILATGHRVIEFVARATVEIPFDNVAIGSRMELYKVPRAHEEQVADSSVLYDGTIDVDSIDPEHVASALRVVDLVMSRMAFAYDVVVEWRTKYRTVEDAAAVAIPTEQDTALYDRYLREFPSDDDAAILDAAIDWYNVGRGARNPFTAFLSYYIALEGVALAITEGEASLGVDFRREPRDARRAREADCIREKYAELYEANPIEFVQSAYFDCIYGIRTRVKAVAELVFGPGHPGLEALFGKLDGKSLSDIRGDLAHGRLRLGLRDDRNLVASRLGLMREVTKEFLTRLAFSLGSSEELPSWSGRHVAKFLLRDPRSALYVNKMDVLRGADWKIRAEWVS